MWAVLFAAVLAAAASGGFIRSDAERGFVDSAGRQRVFHGVNVVFKFPPWLPPTGPQWDPFMSLNDRDFAQLQAWGFNFIRLGVMWPGVTPSNVSWVNATYLSAVASIVDRAARFGIVTLLDLHQDLLSPFFCGEGAPDFLVARPSGLAAFPMPVGLPYARNPATGYPQSCPKSFGIYYPTFAVAEAFQALYENANGFADAFVGYWSAVSSYFAENENVVGLELLNEPFVGDFFRNPSLLEPGVTDRKYLAPLYQRATAAIRVHDSNHIIFFEPMVADVGLSGFDAGPDPNSVYSYHVYCAGQPSQGDEKLCFDELKGTFFLRMEDLARLNTGGMQTEFGAVGDDRFSVQFMQMQTSLCDSRLQSWAYWAYKFFGDPTTQGNNLEGFYFQNGTLQEAKVKALSRTYAQAVQGRLVSMSFDPDSGLFECSFVADTSVAAPTQIFVSSLFFYSRGFVVTAAPAGAAAVSVAGSVVTVAALRNGTIAVTVAAN